MTDSSMNYKDKLVITLHVRILRKLEWERIYESYYLSIFNNLYFLEIFLKIIFWLRNREKKKIGLDVEEEGRGVSVGWRCS